MITFGNSAINHESNSEFMMVPIEKTPLALQASKLQSVYNESKSTDPDESSYDCRDSLKFAATKCNCRPDSIEKYLSALQSLLWDSAYVVLVPVNA